MEHLLQTPVTAALLGLNLAVSLWVLYSAPHQMGRLAFVPYRVVRHAEWSRLFTGSFVHGSGAHLAFNMLTLFFFGPPLEMLLGPGGFLLLYIGSDLCASGLTTLLRRKDPYYSAVGASGAISGVVFAFCMFRPFQMLYLFFAIPIPAILFAVLYIGVSVWGLGKRDASAGGGIAHEAHLGGALGGILFIILLYPPVVQIFVEQIRQVLR